MLQDKLNMFIESAWQFASFMAAGGYVLWLIFALNLLIWMLMLERIWFLERIFPRLMTHTVNSWLNRDDDHSWYAQNIRSMIISRIKTRVTRHLTTIHVCVELLPIMGLLGTIIAMVEMFEVLNIHGTGNPRAVADSISKALLTTMAGLLGAIPGLFLLALLQQKARHKIQQLTDQLSLNSLAKENQQG